MVKHVPRKKKTKPVKKKLKSKGKEYFAANQKRHESENLLNDRIVNVRGQTKNTKKQLKKDNRRKEKAINDIEIEDVNETELLELLEEETTIEGTTIEGTAKEEEGTTKEEATTMGEGTTKDVKEEMAVE